MTWDDFVVNRYGKEAIYLENITFYVLVVATLALFNRRECLTLTTFILWRVKQAANKLCWLASMCKYNTQGSYSYNHRSDQRGSTIDH
jgi:hypothetical protein